VTLRLPAWANAMLSGRRIETNRPAKAMATDNCEPSGPLARAASDRTMVVARHTSAVLIGIQRRGPRTDTAVTAIVHERDGRRFAPCSDFTELISTCDPRTGYGEPSGLRTSAAHGWS
jgi:hypothetical protein